MFSEMEGLCSVAQAGATTRVPLERLLSPARNRLEAIFDISKCNVYRESVYSL